MQQVSLMSLYELGAHRGNSRTHLNPRLKSRVHSFHQGLCVIDLVKTIEQLETTADFFYKLGQKRRQILLVGTSKHIQANVSKYAADFSGSQMPYVDTRWLGGTITNWPTIKETLKKLEKLENIISNQKFFDGLPRNQQLEISREQQKLKTYFEGLKNLKTNRPGAIFLIDAVTNPIAIKEAETTGVPLVLLTNTFIKTLPKSLNYTISCNTNSISAIDFITSRLIETYNNGLNSNNQKESSVSEVETEKVKNV